MKITVFTGNQPRHLSFIKTLATVADEVYAVMESSTVFPGQVADFYKRSPIMQTYFAHVLQAERDLFGGPTFTPPHTRQLILKDGDLNLVDMEALQPALQSDVYVVFGASYIKGALCDFLVQHRAYNIHMGVSPYYRGSSCNFWALFDTRPAFVGATIHLLSKGLDSGPMLFHALPKAEPTAPFSLGMKAVQSAHLGFITYLKTGQLFEMTPVPQEKHLEMRYTRNADFTDEAAQYYLENVMTPEQIGTALQSRQLSHYLNPYIPT